MVLEEAAGDDTDLVIYELGELIPRGSGSGAALQWHPRPGALNASGRLWWIELAAAIVKGVGATRWPKEGTLLAWNEERTLLFVRQDEGALRVVESVLDHIDARQIAAYPVRLELRAGSPDIDGLVLEVDVPGRVPGRACKGTAWTYHCDYDIEVSMGSFLSDPLWCVLETGYGVTAVRRPIEGTSRDDIEIEILLCMDAPRFEPLRVDTLGFGPITIEDPQVEILSWRGRLPAAEGAHATVSLSEACRVEINVGEPKVADGPARRSWRRRGPSAERTAPLQESVLLFELTGSLSGRLGQGELDLNTPRRRAWVGLRECSPAWPPEQAEERRDGPLRLPGTDYGSVAFGKISLELSSLDSAQDPRRLDLTLSVSEWTGDARLVEIELGEREVDEAVIAKRRRQASLPSAHIVVLSRRVFLAPSGDGLLEFQGDLGHGRETLTLSIGRFTAKNYK